MRVAVVGGGLTGLTAAAILSEKNIQTVLFEASDSCGGLAKGFNPGNWKWNLESFYHHIFTNDKEIINLAKKVNCHIRIYNPKTTSYFRGMEVDLDSPISMMKFSGISLAGRIRMGIGLLFLKLIPNGLFLERYKATKVLPKVIGQEGYRAIWEKLIAAKFGPYADEVNLAWFWSRVKKRTKRLGYFDGGFDNLINKTEEFILSHGGEIRVRAEVKNLQEDRKEIEINGEIFDAVIITTPAPTIQKIIPEYKFPKLNYLWGQTLILETSRKMIRGYWMNILEEDFPFLVAVEQTNMIDKKYYGGDRLIYLGNYLPEGNRQLKMNAEQLLKFYIPYLKKINRMFNRKQIKKTFLFRQPYSQPVFPLNYSKEIPNMKYGERIYIANMSMIYPYDRGTNYAVKMGRDVAEMVINNLR